MILRIGAIEHLQHGLPGQDLPDLGAQPVDQIAVVRDQQDGALVVRQHFLQDFLRGDIQVVGWLVQQQQVGLRERELGQRQPAALAAGKRADFLEDVIPAEQEARQVSRGSRPAACSAPRESISSTRVRSGFSPSCAWAK